MSTNDTVWQALTPQAKGSLRVIAGLLAEKYTGQLQLDCNQGGVRAITKVCRIPLTDEPETAET